MPVSVSLYTDDSELSGSRFESSQRIRLKHRKDVFAGTTRMMFYVEESSSLARTECIQETPHRQSRHRSQRHAEPVASCVLGQNCSSLSVNCDPPALQRSRENSRDEGKVTSSRSQYSVSSGFARHPKPHAYVISTAQRMAMGGEPVCRSIESGVDNLGWILRSIILPDDRDCGGRIGGRTNGWLQGSVQN